MKPAAHRAVMAQRREPPDSLEFFPTPPWATRALCRHILRMSPQHRELAVWEPAAGEGHMAEVLGEFFADVFASDVFDYGKGYSVGSFIGDGIDVIQRPPLLPSWVITNPPFSVAQAFAERGRAIALRGTALLVRFSWLEGVDRYHEIFRDNAPTRVAVFSERVPMQKGLWNPDGSTATFYAWVIWDAKPEHPGKTLLEWIPPGCRESLTLPGDVARFAPPKPDPVLPATVGDLFDNLSEVAP